ncbi:MAG: tRNA lysidine(34) synthetase TilS, partial [Chitinophagales bacterium]|nr:tRNA lysidine(34) synthetase TilS [Chitinophagales bacterium]
MQRPSFTEQFQTFISENHLCRKHEPVLLAVSGGIDSVVLTELFRASNYNFGIAHCNFQLRGTESDTEEDFVQELAQQLQVPFYVKRFDTTAYQKKNKLSPEEAARNLRYTWFEEIRAAFGFQSIATAHHLNDSIETIILNITKGTGIKGLMGIPVKNSRVIRPLLFASRKEIESFAEENNLLFKTDSSNLTDDYQRNMIRHHIIPKLKEINPALENTFKKNIQNFNDAELIYREHITNKLTKLIETRKDAIYISINRLKNLPASATYMFEIVKQFGFNAEQSSQIHDHLYGSGKQFLSDTHNLIIDRKFLIITPLKPEQTKHIVIEKENKTISAADFKLKFSLSNLTRPLKMNHSDSIIYADAANIEYPLTLRVWKRGDYLYPL